MTFAETSFPARDRLNSRMVREVRVTGPASYTTGGDPILPAANLGMAEVYGVYGTLSNGSTILGVWLNYATQTLVLYVTSTDAQVANAVDLSGFTGTLLFTGKG